MKFYRRLQSKITCLLIISNGLFNRTKTRQSETEQSPVILTSTILPRSNLTAKRLLIIELDPIERRNLGHRHSPNVYWICLRVLVPLRKLRLHGNAHRSCTQFVFLSRIGRTLEHAALKHLPFCGRDHACREVFSDAIIASSISNSRKSSRSTIDLDVISSSIDFAISTSLIQCAMRICSLRSYFILEVDFPALKFRWSQEIFQMQFRDWKSRKSNHTIMRKSSTSMIQHATSTLEMEYRYGWILWFSSHFIIQPLCNSFSIRSQFLRGRCQILGIVEESRSSSFSSRWSFNNVSWRTRCTPRIVRQSKTAARHGPGTRNSRGVDWERGSLPSCSQFQDRKNSLASEKELIYFVLHFLNLSQHLTHRRGIPLLMHRQFINSCLSCSICFFALNSSFFNVLAVFCSIFSEEYSSFPIRHTSVLCLFEPVQSTDSPVVAEIVGTRTPDWSRKEQHQNFSFPNVPPPRLAQLSVQGFCRFWLSLNFSQRLGLELSSLLT